jgi:hypothetical protein
VSRSSKELLCLHEEKQECEKCHQKEKKEMLKEKKEMLEKLQLSENKIQKLVEEN